MILWSPNSNSKQGLRMDRKTTRQVAVAVNRYTCAMVLLCIVLWHPGLRVAGASDVDRIVAIVNDDIIVLSELEPLLVVFRERIVAMGYPEEKERETLFEIRENILNKLIDDKLRDQEVAKSDITVTVEEVDSAIEGLKQQNALTDEELRAALSVDGLTMADYRKQVREEILRAKLMNQEVRAKIIITQEDVESYYKRNDDKYGGQTNYHLRHILLTFASPVDEDLKEQVKTEMDGILERLGRGEPFEALAKQYSQSPTSRLGGDLGVLELSTLSEKIQAAVVSLTPGETSPPVETDQGYQIFLLQQIITEPGIPLEAVSAEIEEALYKEIIEERYSGWIEKLREGSHIKIIR